MATTGQVFPGSAESVSESPWSDNTWTAPTNILADDGNEASVTAGSYDAPDQTFVLKAFNFDFSGIPDGSTINGVTARFEARVASTDDADVDLCQLLDTSRAKVGTNKASTPIDITTTSTVYTQGGASDLWGNSLTAAWVKDPDFGIALAYLATAANADVFFDYVTLEIDYTPPSIDLPIVVVAPR